MNELPRVLHAFPGGLALPGRRAPSAADAPSVLPMPPRLAVPLLQHVGRANRPSVAVGDRVRAGEVLARPPSYVGATVHAPAGGRIAALERRPTSHQRVADVDVLVLETEPGGEVVGCGAALDPRRVEPGAIVARAHEAGVVGLGGAGFPAHVKLGEGLAAPVELLVINAVECEPWITCDDCLVRSRADDVVAGAALVARAVGAPEVVIALEDDMPEARAALDAALGRAERSEGTRIELVSVPSRYPAGGEKQLIYALTGRHVPAAGLPLDLGVVMHNVATAVAVHDAVVRARPVVDRIVTVTGAVARPGNLQVPVGAPVADLIAAVGGVTAARPRVLLGGPMMGMEVEPALTPVTKTTNCVLVLDEDAPEGARLAEERPCIRCGDCVGACPAGLQPQALLESCLDADYDEAQDLSLFECIECGCCAYVCPSAIPLVHHYRHAKSVIESMDEDHEAAELARERCRVKRAREGDAADALAAAPDLVDLEGTDGEALRRMVAEAVARRRGRE